MASNALPSGAQRASNVLHHCEDALLALLLGAMVVLAPLQIVLRALLGTGITWIDPLLRVLVLWLGMFGAVVACREGRHITVDVVSRLLGGRTAAAVGAFTNLVTAGVAGIVSYHSGRFVASERAFESVAFSGVPAWMLEIAIPLAFAVIALRYLSLARVDATTLIRGEAAETAGQ